MIFAGIDSGRAAWRVLRMLLLMTTKQVTLYRQLGRLYLCANKKTDTRPRQNTLFWRVMPRQAMPIRMRLRTNRHPLRQQRRQQTGRRMTGQFID
jgi:hypothetical protein